MASSSDKTHQQNDDTDALYHDADGRAMTTVIEPNDPASDQNQDHDQQEQDNATVNLDDDVR
ncbi:hypothetical protein A2U01_0109069, partial [Trifolium medium]|nr:hypothetical protein [Trifolium medium]